MKFMFSNLFIHLIVWFNIYKNEHNAKLVTLMIQGVRVYYKIYYLGITMDVKNQQLLWNLYASTTMVIKNPTSITRPICKYCNGCKKLATIMRPICEYYNGYKKPNIYYETYM
jgi:hypothetical protein